jgi:DUF4097 and DUF4098 domain-containing protein YvlB
VEQTVEDRAEIELGPITSVSVDLIGGNVEVLVGRRGASASNRLLIDRVERSPVIVRCEGGHLEIEQRKWAGRPSRFGFGLMRGPRADVALVVTEPLAARVATVSADVTAAGTTETDIKTISGDVTVSAAGPSRLDTVSGDIDATGLTGDLRLKSVSGDVTVAGGVASRLRATNVSGDMTFDVDLQSGRHELRNVSGDVAMRVGAGGASLRIRSTSGDLRCAGATTEVGLAHRKVAAVIGAGQADLDIVTVSGDVDVVPSAVVV